MITHSFQERIRRHQRSGRQSSIMIWIDHLNNKFIHNTCKPMELCSNQLTIDIVTCGCCERKAWQQTKVQTPSHGPKVGPG